MTKLTTEDLVRVAEKMGCEVQEQSSFLKISRPGDATKAAYIGKTKKTVTRIDFAGFTPEEHVALRRYSDDEAKERGLGAVRGQILTRELEEDVTDDHVMDAWRKNLKLVLSEEPGFKSGRGVRRTSTPPVDENLKKIAADVAREFDESDIEQVGEVIEKVGRAVRESAHPPVKGKKK